MPLPTFSEYYNCIKNISECIENNDGTFENFFELLESKGLNVETVMTSDIATMTVPIASLKRRPPVMEVAPEGKDAEDFILKNKLAFKRRYGDNWKEVLYATAWKLFGDKK